MNRILLLLFFIPFFTSAQETSSTPKNEKHYVYAEIVGTERMLSTKVDVVIDYGQETKFFNPDNNRIMDDATGKPKKFNSMVDAMNLMGTLGWEFVQGYAITISGSSVYHWLMKRELKGTDLEKYLPTIRKDLKKTTN